MITSTHSGGYSIYYEDEQKKLRNSVSELTAYIETAEQKSADVTSFIQVVQKYEHITELTPEIMHELIVVGSNHIDFTNNLKKYISEDESLINNDNEPVTTNVSAVNTNIPISTTTTAVTTTVSQQTSNTGDLNSDGIINAVDASIVLTYYAMMSTNQKGDFNDTQKKAADIDKNGDINAVDASYILSYYAYTSTTKDTSKKTLEEFLK